MLLVPALIILLALNWRLDTGVVYVSVSNTEPVRRSQILMVLSKLPLTRCTWSNCRHVMGALCPGKVRCAWPVLTIKKKVNKQCPHKHHYPTYNPTCESCHQTCHWPEQNPRIAVLPQNHAQHSHNSWQCLAKNPQCFLRFCLPT